MGPTIQFWTRDRPRIADVGEDLRHQLVLHLGQGRVHHEDEPDGDEQVGVGAHLQPLVERLHRAKKNPSATPMAMAAKIQTRQEPVQ
jgi:hypothetical protein